MCRTKGRDPHRSRSLVAKCKWDSTTFRRCCKAFKPGNWWRWRWPSPSACRRSPTCRRSPRRWRDSEMAPWVGIVAPARTPKEIVERLSQETLAIMHDTQVVKQLPEQQVTPFALTSDRFGELISKDLEKWAGVIKTAGIKGE